MKTEEDIRQALQEHAATHAINPNLPRSTITKARLSRFAMMAGAGVVAVSVAFAGFGIAGVLGDSERHIEIGAGEPTESETKRGAPLLLITAEGWRVIRADAQTPKMGEISFTNGTDEIELFWRPADTHEDYVQDRAAGSHEPWEITVAGHEGVLFQYEGTADFTALWLDEPLSLELRGGFDNIDEYRAVAETLAFVSEDRWLSALPEGTVKPSQRPAVVDEMLKDIPVHPSVDVDKLKNAPTVSDRYQLGAQVTGAVTCAWIEQWVDAKAKDDRASAKKASDAMATSHDWAILKEMRDQGGWSPVVWEYADAMANDEEIIGGRALSIEESYKDSFGCDYRP